MVAYDAVLVHAHWLSQKGKGKVELSFRSYLNTLAAGLLYQAGKVDNLVFTAGKIWGPEYPSVAELMAKKLMEKYKVPQSRIFIKDKGFTTDEEIKIFLELASKNGWNKLLDVANKAHLWTIPQLYKRQGGHTDFQTVEEIIKEKGDEEIRRLIRQFSQSRYELCWRLYMGVVRVVMIFDPDYKFLGKIANGYRHQKGHMIPLSIFSELLKMDKYDL